MKQTPGGAAAHFTCTTCNIQWHVTETAMNKVKECCKGCLKDTRRKNSTPGSITWK
jgi:hypothetical protein